jgi:hypothetical protein
MRWRVIGFTSDEIVVAHQEARLAEQCVKAWRSAGSPSECRIVEAAGEGNYLLFWFVNEAAAAMLDAGGVPWQSRILDERQLLPPSHQDILELAR